MFNAISSLFGKTKPTNLISVKHAGWEMHETEGGGWRIRSISYKTAETRFPSHLEWTILRRRYREELLKRENGKT